MFSTLDSRSSRADAFSGPFLAYWPSTDFFHSVNICVSEPECEGKGEEGELGVEDGLEVVVEGDDNAGISESEGAGSVNDCTTGDEDRT